MQDYYTCCRFNKAISVVITHGKNVSIVVMDLKTFAFLLSVICLCDTAVTFNAVYLHSINKCKYNVFILTVHTVRT